MDKNKSLAYRLPLGRGLRSDQHVKFSVYFVLWKQYLGELNSIIKLIFFDLFNTFICKKKLKNWISVFKMSKQKGMQKNATIAEIQGPYGPINLTEACLQKIWERGDFKDHGLKTLEGNSLHLFSRGQRNHYEGPDFIGAEIAIDGQRFVGDIEVHLYASNWLHHGHNTDVNFAKVILHVVLFEPQERAFFLQKANGHSLCYTLLLLPLLKRDLESYAMEDALMVWDKEKKENLSQSWLNVTVEERRQRLKDRAQQRWKQKVYFAQKRVTQWGWDEACHQSCLEVLGYLRNRIPMADLSLRFPLKEMLRSPYHPDRLFATESGWKLMSLRPANHPLLRLKQYLSLLKNQPNWTSILKAFFNEEMFLVTEGIEEATAIFRRQKKVYSLKNMLKHDILCDAFSGRRLDTILCDAFWPLGQTLTSKNFFSFWFHWFPGDVPGALRDFQKSLEVTDGKHYLTSNGLNQGCLQSFIERNE